MEPNGHRGLESYCFGVFFFVVCFFLFLCILTGVAATIRQVIMASDYLPPAEGMHACTPSPIPPCHAGRLVSLAPPPRRAVRAPGLLSAKWCSESLKHRGGDRRCAARSLRDIVKYPVTNMVPRVGESPAPIPSPMSCSG